MADGYSSTPTPAPPSGSTSTPASGPASVGSSSPAWEKSYQEAANEADAEKLAARVEAAEGAMFERLQEFSADASTDHTTERGLIDEASRVLLKIKTEKLKWPRFGLRGDGQPTHAQAPPRKPLNYSRAQE